MPSTTIKKDLYFGDDFFPLSEKFELLIVSEGSQRRVVANGISILNCRLEASPVADHERDSIGRSRTRNPAGNVSSPKCHTNANLH
jgi:hypothetical protein